MVWFWAKQALFIASMHIVYAVIIHFGDLVMMKNEDKFEKYCKYCEKAKTLSDPDRMLCP